MQKYSFGVLKEYLLILAAFLLLMLALVLPVHWASCASLTAEEQSLLQARETGELIRIHVVANSDSQFDQAIKLHVRDAVLTQLEQLIDDAAASGSDHVFELLKQSVPQIQNVAEKCARIHGYNEKITTEVGMLQLPSKHYRSILLPEGTCRSVRITLGSGKGQNWWSTLFPQLCLDLTDTEKASETRLFWTSGRIFQNWLLSGR